MDVYGCSDLTELRGGFRKHTFSIYVGDETGMINKVSSVFSRRGFNIESLAVGLNGRKALFTVVALVDDRQAVQLVRQLLKMVKVEAVQDITGASLLERELELVKVRASAGSQRSEVLELAQVYRASVVDISEGSVTLSVAGDRGKCSSLERMLRKFGIMQLARAGKVGLVRGSTMRKEQWDAMKTIYEVEEDGAHTRANVLASSSSSSSSSSPSGTVTDESEEEEDDEDEDEDEEGGDVYPDRGGPRVWEVDTFAAGPTPAATTGATDEDSFDSTEATNPDANDSNIVESTLSILVENLPGVLSVVTGVFTQRGYNIQSLAVGPAESRGTSRITMVVPGTYESIANLAKQLEKRPSVMKVTDMTRSPFAERELMLVRVRSKRKQRSELLDLATMFRARVADVSEGTLTLEVTGDREKMDALQALLRPYGVLEVARTGRVSLPRESGVDTAMLQRFQTHTRLF